jgi:hypothetical protein
MKELVRIFVPRFALAMLISLGFALSCAVAHGEESRPEQPDSDVFVTPREALLRERPSLRGNIVGKLPQGTRLKLVGARDRYLKVEVPGRSQAWIAREVTVVFAPDEEGTQDMVVVGRSFGKTDANRRLAASILLRASERLRESKTPDPDVEVLLGETVEGVIAAGAPYPAGIGIVEQPGPSGPRARYDGTAFKRAAEMLSKDASEQDASTRERAAAGLLRAQYPERATAFQPLLQETAAWIQLLETAEDPGVLASSAERAGTGSLALGRFYLALGKTEEIARLRDRLYAAGLRLRALSPDRLDGKRLVSRAAVLGAMRGNGTPSFPQEASVTGGSRQRVVRIQGKLGALQLVVETQAGSTKEVQARKAAVPILPVPGSLRISPDGRSVAWIEVSAPARMVPVMTSLERDEEAREIAFLSTGRPLRDRELSHVVSSLSGFSKDGQRLGLVIEAWNDTPGPAPRYSIVSASTGELLFETSEDMRTYQRLLR